MRFRPIDSLSRAANAFSQDLGYALLRTLATLALLFLLYGVIFALVVGSAFFAGAGLASMGTGMAMAGSPLALFTSVGIAVAVVVLVVLLVGLILGAMLQLGLVRSLLRYIVSGERRYDLFAPFGKSMQYITFYVLLGITVSVLSYGITYLATVSAILSAVVAVVFVLLLVWIIPQLSFLQYRMFSHDENAFAAAAGSYRMLVGSRWLFLLTFLGLAVVLGLVQFILGLVPFLGVLLVLVLQFLMIPYLVLWLAIVHQDLEPVKSVD